MSAADHGPVVGGLSQHVRDEIDHWLAKFRQNASARP